MNRVLSSNEVRNEIDARLVPGASLSSAAAEQTLAADTEPARAGPGELDRLYAGLADVTATNHPRTARLLASGRRRAAQKVIEEAGEVALEAVKCRAAGLVRESADLLYHLVVLWRRADAMGIAEKLPKAPRIGAAASRRR